LRVGMELCRRNFRVGAVRRGRESLGLTTDLSLPRFR